MLPIRGDDIPSSNGDETGLLPAAIAPGGGLLIGGSISTCGGMPPGIPPCTRVHHPGALEVAMVVDVWVASLGTLALVMTTYSSLCPSQEG
jgi:hypothetical protein